DQAAYSFSRGAVRLGGSSGAEPAAVDQTISSICVGQLPDHGADVAMRILLLRRDPRQFHHDVLETRPADDHPVLPWCALKRPAEVIDNHPCVSELADQRLEARGVARLEV